MKVLFLPFNPIMYHWYEGFVKAIDGRYPIELYDPNQPMAPQFEGIGVVVTCAGCIREMIDAAVDADVKLWQVLSVGVDHWDVSYFREKGLPFANTPGPFSAIALAEHALFLLFLITKNYHTAHANVRTEVFNLPLNDELAGKKLGVVGLGASGRELARRAHALGMQIWAIDIVDIPQEIRAECHVEFFGGPSMLERMLGEVDYLSLHTPLTAKTRHLIGQREFEQMKTTAVLINVARGALVDETALVAAVQSGQIRAAGLDVFAEEPLEPAHPLLQMENVVCTPHVAGVTNETVQRRGQAGAENVDRVARGLPALHLVTDVESMAP